MGQVCPACRSSLASGSESWTCFGCGRAFPIVAGLVDLRLHPDRYLDLAADRAKAEALARLDRGGKAADLAAAYYDMTADVDARRRARFIAHIEGAVRRGEALAALLPRTGRILEVGCGTGGLLVAAGRAGRAIEGVDIALRWLVVARRRLEDHGLDVGLFGACAERLPWTDGTFDAVVADSVLEHLDDPEAALKEWRRVVRPGGRLVVWSPNRFSVATDPHVGLWGVGWLPRRVAARYVRMRRGCDWKVRPLSAASARRLALGAGWRGVEVEPVRVPIGWSSGRRGRGAIRIYEAMRGRPIGRAILRRFGPLWQLVATREAES
jgi:SAM-dependent methyltransferase